MTNGGFVLLVEPNRWHGNSARDVLEAAGFTVCLVSTFGEAKVQLARQPPDILISSIRLGAYNGLDLVLRCRLCHPHCKAIVTTEFPDSVLRAEAEKHRATFLLRPFENADLLNLVLEPATPSV